MRGGVFGEKPIEEDSLFLLPYPLRDEIRTVFHNYYEFLKNLSEKSFEDFWREVADIFKHHNPTYQTIDEYSERLDDDFKYLSFRYWGEQKKQPSVIEVQEKLKALLNEPCNYCVLWVNHCTNESISSLSKKFSEIIKQKRKQVSVKYHWYFPWLYPGIRYDEVKRYLQVYDLKNQQNPKLKWQEIAKLIYPKINWSESLRRSLLIDLSSAEKIIKNVEKGIFPGKY